MLDCIAVVLIVIGIRFRKEKLVNLIIISLMIFTGGSILVNSIQSLFYGPEPISNLIFIVIIALLSIFLNTYLRILKNFVGKKNRNSSLIASAIDSKVNIILSISIIIGALLSNLGTSLGIPFFHYFDPIIAIFVCILIFKEVIEIIRDLITSKEEEIESSIPSIETIQKGVDKIKTHMSQENRKSEIEILSKALKAEVETRNFYERMVNELPDEGKRMFASFLEIEKNHIDAVQFELDYLTKTGYWFDFKEFDMEEL